MKIQNLLSRSIRMLFSLIIITGGILLLSGCSQTVDTNQQTTQIERPEHLVNLNPTSLNEAEAVLTLVDYGAKGALADNNLSIADMLMYAIQDEYLAHGEYEAIIEKFGNVTPFANIVKSEEAHIASLSKIYIAYGINIPKDDSAAHIIVPISLLEGAKTCVQAEIDNIAMYELFLSYELLDDIRDVFTTLKSASESHLKSFEKQVDRLS